jgi:ketosteroid isomerase-like protein
MDVHEQQDDRGASTHSRGGAMTTKAQENVALIRRGFEAFNKGDLATLSELLTTDCVQHMPGNNRFTGDRKGRDNILAMYGEMAQLTDGTMQAVLSDVYATDHGAVGLYTASAKRNGQTINEKYALVFTIVDGKVIELDDTPLNGKVNDAFWE